jgi:hypothetical protein
MSARSVDKSSLASTKKGERRARGAHFARGLRLM